MRILLTNNTLSDRSGSELYIRDIALAYLALGHEPIAYSRHLGEVANELRSQSVLVVDDLSKLTEVPDIIHAQHHLEAMTAISQFCNTPAIYICHGWLPPQEAPPAHPNIVRYIAVDKLVELRLIEECGIPKHKVETRLNFVDLHRFSPRESLPEKPKRALAFSNYMNEGNVLPVLRQACEQNGITLDCLGLSAGTAHEHPELVLGDYDIVFAKGRAALEAAAVGCAVIVCDAAGVGKLVTSDNLSELRSYNFGLRLLRKPCSVDNVLTEIHLYRASDTRLVMQRLRADIDLTNACAFFLDLYSNTIQEHKAKNNSLEKSMLALSNYLRFGPVTSDFSQYDKDQYRKQLGRYEEQVQHLNRHAVSIQQHLQDVQQELGVTQDLNANLNTELNHSQQSHQESLRHLEQQCNVLKKQLNITNGELNAVQNSASWRLRKRLINRRWVKGFYNRVIKKVLNM